MEIAIIGLGRMGMNIARRLLRDDHRVFAHNRTAAKIDRIVAEGATGLYDLADLGESMNQPRVIWLMLPAGGVVDEYIDRVLPRLTAGDIIIDGGNSYYRDGIRRSAMLEKEKIHFVDVGVSGGIWGLERGYCLMYGGGEQVCRGLEPIFRSLAPEGGFLHCGPAGAGHFVKMVHNGIEYGMMQAIGEGFAILERSPYNESLDFSRLSHLWNQGSVIRSWLLELAGQAFARDGRLEELSGRVDDSGEGRWTVQQAVESGVPAPVIALSLFNRFQSRQENDFGNRVLAALRREFGGHPVTLRDRSQNDRP